MNVLKLSFVAALAAGSAASGQTATVNASAQNYNGFADASGTALAAGDLVEIGYFKVSDAQLQADAKTPGALNTDFVTYGVAGIGDNLSGTPGYFADTFVASTTGSSRPDGVNLAGQQIAFWVFNASTQKTATQQGIYYLSDSVSPDWAFKADSANPNVSNPDIADLTGGTNTLIAGAHIVLGAFGPATLSPPGISNATAFELVPIAVPEPSSLLMAFAGAVPLFFRLRRK